MGNAYALFACRASKDEIEKELPVLRNVAQTPGSLETKLFSGVPDLPETREHPDLRDILHVARGEGINYTMAAQSPRLTNKQAAGELTHLLDIVYAGSSLYYPKEPFRGQVVYEENGRYEFHD